MCDGNLYNSRSTAIHTGQTISDIYTRESTGIRTQCLNIQTHDRAAAAAFLRRLTSSRRRSSASASASSCFAMRALGKFVSGYFGGGRRGVRTFVSPPFRDRDP